MSQKDVESILSNPEVIDYIANYNYDDLYQLIRQESPRVIGELTTVLYKSNLLDLQYLTTIPEFMFYGSKGINYLKLPSSIKTIEYAAYSYSEIQGIGFNSGLESIQKRSFAHSDLDGDLILPDTVQNIEGAAFMNTRIRSIILPSKLQTIGARVFAECSNLKEVIFTNPAPLDKSFALKLQLPFDSCAIHLPKSWRRSGFYAELKELGYNNIHFD